MTSRIRKTRIITAVGQCEEIAAQLRIHLDGVDKLLISSAITGQQLFPPVAWEGYPQRVNKLFTVLFWYYRPIYGSATDAKVYVKNNLLNLFTALNNSDAKLWKDTVLQTFAQSVADSPLTKLLTKYPWIEKLGG